MFKNAPSPSNRKRYKHQLVQANEMRVEEKVLKQIAWDKEDKFKTKCSLACYRSKHLFRETIFLLKI